MHHIETIRKLLKDELSHRVVVGPNPRNFLTPYKISYL